jgi:hypothetical protein
MTQLDEKAAKNNSVQEERLISAEGSVTWAKASWNTNFDARLRVAMKDRVPTYLKSPYTHQHETFWKIEGHNNGCQKSGPETILKTTTICK